MLYTLVLCGLVYFPRLWVTSCIIPVASPCMQTCEATFSDCLTFSTVSASVRFYISCNFRETSLSSIPTTTRSRIFSSLLLPKSQYSHSSYKVPIKSQLSLPVFAHADWNMPVRILHSFSVQSTHQTLKAPDQNHFYVPLRWMRTISSIFSDSLLIPIA